MSARSGKKAPLRVLFVASECAPYAKCGGLGDVVAALPKALADAGADVRILMPLYDCIERERWGLVPDGAASIAMGGGETNGVALWRATAEGGVPVLFLEHERYYARGGIYDFRGEAYGDQAWRFGLLCRAAMQLCGERGWTPDIVHVHDWPTALLPVMMASRRFRGDPWGRVRSVLTIHNQCYQGYSPASALPYLGLGSEVYHPGILESYGQLNLLKGGIATADAVTTVSPGYAREILGEPGGCGLSGHLRARGDAFSGILNGADYSVWNPETDPCLPAWFNAWNPDDGKAACKRALREELGLAPSDAPLFGMVSRLVEQKGVSLLREALPRALGAMEMQVAILGAGNPADEDFLRDLAARHPGRVAVRIGYSEALSHRIIAGSDFFLMPSLYEPCGLTQIYAMRYGSLPLVHATGGLDDTVEQYNEGTADGTGFKFYDASAQAFFDVVGWAVSTWFDRPGHYRALRHRAMLRRFEWGTAAQAYLDVYRRILP